MNPFEEMVLIMEQAAIEAHKFYNKGNKAAGVRLRALMMKVKEQTQVVRKDVVRERA